MKTSKVARDFAVASNSELILVIQPKISLISPMVCVNYETNSKIRPVYSAFGAGVEVNTASSTRLILDETFSQTRRSSAVIGAILVANF